MKEEYLQAIWRMKRLPVNNLYLSDGRRLTIKNTGLHNHDSGPDFFNGSVEIDGLTWNGNIEVHVNSSDWYLHKHHLDSSYKNVILHIVFKHDREIFIEDQKIPTLEMSSLIDFNHWNNYRNLLLSQTWIPCEKSIQNVERHIVFNQIENLSIQRLSRKNKLLQQTFLEVKKDPLKLYYEIYAKAFGLKVNTLAFIELTKKLNFKTIWKSNKEQAKILVLGVAGFFQDSQRFGLEKDFFEWNYLKKKYNLDEMDLSSWKFKGLRPPSFPNLKLIQFSELCLQKDFFYIHELETEQILNLLKKLNFSEDFSNNILINAIIPIFWWNYTYFQIEKYKNIALDLLMKTKSEDNQIIKKWKNLGINAKSSFETQGLLELKNELCVKSQCLNCKIGYAILKT